MSYCSKSIRLTLYLLGGLILLFTGFWAQNSSFDSIQKMRQMERVPNVSAHHVIPAEVSIWGKALKSEQLIKSRYTKTNCLYHRYLKKKEKRDSDGDTTWVTVESGERSVDFFLADDTGKVLVELSKGGIQPDLNEDYEKEEVDFGIPSGELRKVKGCLPWPWERGKREICLFDLIYLEPMFRFCPMTMVWGIGQALEIGGYCFLLLGSLACVLGVFFYVLYSGFIGF